MQTSDIVLPQLPGQSHILGQEAFLKVKGNLTTQGLRVLRKGRKSITSTFRLGENRREVLLLEPVITEVHLMFIKFYGITMLLALL